MSAPRLCLAAACLLTLQGCIADRPRPLAAAQNSQALESRSLTEPRLNAFLDAAGQAAAGQAAKDAAGRPRRWDLASLTLAALYYHPSLEVARAQLAGAQAAVREAAQPPDPTLNFQEISRSTAGPVQWTITPLIDFLIETGGERAALTREARAQVDAARAALLTQSWSVRAAVREALLSLWAARAAIALKEQALALEEELTTLLEHRLTAGEASGMDVARERTHRNEAKLGREAAQTQLDTARAQLAASLGVPLSALEGVEISLDAFEAPAAPPGGGELRQAALTGRSDVQELLAQYAAAQAALSFAIAGQYPDLTLSPGYQFDKVQNRYFLAPTLTLPLHGNRGAIAVAQARREEAAARFTELQARIIASIDSTQVQYRAAVRTLDTADALLAGETEREQRTARAFAAGALDRPSWLSVQLERNAAAQSRLSALIQQREGLGALEDALQQPILGPAPIAVPLREPASP